MTPERIKYLAKCNSKELMLRSLIADEKQDIRRLKQFLKPSTGCAPWARITQFYFLKQHKLRLAALQHELARLKDMDRLGDDEPYINNLTGVDYCVCKCSAVVYKTDNYCANCGKRILWG